MSGHTRSHFRKLDRCVWGIMRTHTHTAISGSLTVCVCVCVCVCMRMHTFLWECLWVCVCVCSCAYMSYATHCSEEFVNVCGSYNSISPTIMFMCQSCDICYYKFYVCACVCFCMPIHMCMCVFVYAYTYVHRCVCVCLYICAYVCLRAICGVIKSLISPGRVCNTV